MSKCPYLMTSLTTLLLSLSVASSAFAQEGEAASTTSEVARAKPTPKFQATARVRAIHVPNFVLSTWFSQHANTWAEGQKNFAYGVDFGWRNLSDLYELSFAIDWSDLRMKPSFWLEDGEPAQAAKYTEVNLQVLSFTFSSAWYWELKPWISPYMGAGIGIGVPMGDILKYRPRQGSSCRAKLGSGDEPFRPPECFDANGDPRADQIDLDNPEDDGNFLPVLPMVQAMAGVRFNIYDYGIIKLELGLHDYLYAGTSVGVQW